jgi:hypothetical protein
MIRRTKRNSWSLIHDVNYPYRQENEQMIDWGFIHDINSEEDRKRNIGLLIYNVNFNYRQENKQREVKYLAVH